jgi:hypothetical protein
MDVQPFPSVTPFNRRKRLRSSRSKRFERTKVLNGLNDLNLSKDLESLECLEQLELLSRNVLNGAKRLNDLNGTKWLNPSRSSGQAGVNVLRASLSDTFYGEIRSVG